MAELITGRAPSPPPAPPVEHSCDLCRWHRYSKIRTEFLGLAHRSWQGCWQQVWLFCIDAMAVCIVPFDGLILPPAIVVKAIFSRHFFKAPASLLHGQIVFSSNPVYLYLFAHNSVTYESFDYPVHAELCRHIVPTDSHIGSCGGHFIFRVIFFAKLAFFHTLVPSQQVLVLRPIWFGFARLFSSC